MSKTDPGAEPQKALPPTSTQATAISPSKQQAPPTFALAYLPQRNLRNEKWTKIPPPEARAFAPSQTSSISPSPFSLHQDVPNPDRTRKLSSVSWITVTVPMSQKNKKTKKIKTGFVNGGWRELGFPLSTPLIIHLKSSLIRQYTYIPHPLSLIHNTITKILT